MRQLGLLIFCCILSIPVLSGTPDTINVLKKELQAAESDSQKADALLRIVSTFNYLGYYDSSAHFLAETQQFITQRKLNDFQADVLIAEASLLKESNQLDQAESLLADIMRLPDAKQRSEIMARALNILGQIMHIKGNYAEAIQAFKDARNLYAGMEDSLKVAGLEQNLAVVLGGMGLADRAVEHYFNSLRIVERLGSKQNRAILLNNIGRSLDELGDNEAAIRYLTQAIEISKEIGDRSTLSMAYLNLAILHSKLEDYQLCLFYLQLAEDNLPIPPPVSRLARVYYNRGHTYAMINDFENAALHYYTCLSISREAGLLMGVGNALLGLSEISVKNEQFSLAREQVSEAIQIANDVGDMDLKVAATRVQYVIYRELGLFQQALESAELHFVLKDSMMNIQKAEAISRIQTAYETEKKEQENLMLLAEKKHNEALLQAQSFTIRKQYWAVGIVSLAVVLMGIALSLFFRQKKRLKRALGILSVQNEELSKTREELQELNDTKDRFFSIIAHDLKSPFTALLGFTAILDDEAEALDTAKRRNIIKDFRLAVQATYDLLENLLAWAETQRGTLKVEPVSIHLDKLIEDACHIQMIRAKAKGIDIRKDMANDCVVWADIKITAAVMRNLLSNAIKFSASGSEILIRCKSTGNQAVVSIIDQGVGIEPAIEKDLFRIDKRTSKPGTQNETGTGLGLVMCREFVEMQGGVISLKNNPTGKGTIASFTLPLAKDS